MKLRDGPLLLLAGWFVVINYGTTYPKDGSSIDFAQPSGFGGPFKTRAECEAEGSKSVREFYAEAKARHEKVASPTTFQCKQRRTKE